MADEELRLRKIENTKKWREANWDYYIENQRFKNLNQLKETCFRKNHSFTLIWLLFTIKWYPFTSYACL